MSLIDSISGKLLSKSPAEVVLDISGITPARADSLRAAGFQNMDDIKNASQEELSSVEGISTALAARIKASLGDIDLEEKTPSTPEPSEEKNEEVKSLPEVIFKEYEKKFQEIKRV